MSPEKERQSCITCGKRLKLTEINLCSCGKPVCTKHRYHTEHECDRVLVYHIDPCITPKKVVKI